MRYNATTVAHPVSDNDNTTQVDSRGRAWLDEGTFELVVLKGALQGKRFSVSPGQTILGKSEDADVQIPDSGVSRRHAKLVIDEEGIQLIDLSSTNGTFVNGASVEFTRLKPDDVIHIGAVAELQLIAVVGPGGLPGLSSRQLEVAALVAQGLTNAEIAQRLEISPRTVSSHLDHIYDRLGLRSRAALATWLSQQKR